MDNVCECETQSPYKGLLGDIKGDEIIDVEVIGGGHKYCDKIEMKLKSGKFLQISKHLDVSKYRIEPRVEYKIGAWFSFNPNGNTEDDCPGQKLFNFTN